MTKTKKKKKAEGTVFTEEDFQKFQQEYFGSKAPRRAQPPLTSQPGVGNPWGSWQAGSPREDLRSDLS